MALKIRRQGLVGDRQLAAAGGDATGRAGWSGRTVGDVARPAGRVVLWVLVGLLLVRGLGDVVSSRPAPAPAPAAVKPTGVDGEREAFAARFARVYLSWRAGETAAHARAVASFFVPDLRDRAAAIGLPRRGPGQLVAQATVARSQDLGSGRALITVASQLAGSPRTVYLTVPVARDVAGGLGVFAPPAVSAPPPAGAATVSAPPPVAGADVGEVRPLVGRFLAAYLSGGSAGLSYLVAPGASVGALVGGLRLVSLDGVGQLVRGPGRLLVEADVRVRDQATGASYPLAYRLELVRSDRWYVRRVQGGPQS